MVSAYQIVIYCCFSVLTQVIARDMIFVTDVVAGKIWKAPIETLDFTDIPVQYIESPVDVHYDPVDHKLYWTDEGLKAIMRANIDGTQEQVVVPHLSIPGGLSIDARHRHLYWTDAGNDRIERSNLDGSDKTIIIEENLEQPRAIEIHVDEGLMYWTDTWNNSKIERSSLDGSNRTVLVDTDLGSPYGLTIDVKGNRIYWCDAGLNTIDSADLNGLNRVNLGTFSQELNYGIDIHPLSIAVYKDYVYWSDFSVAQLLKMNKFFGQTALRVGPSVFESAGGLHIFEDEVNECSSNPCNAGECIDEINFYTCNCTSTGFKGERCEKAMQSPSLECTKPGDIDNGLVINQNDADILIPGTSLTFLCTEEYSLVGAKTITCQIDGTWSDKSPSCVAKEIKESIVTSNVAYGGGFGAALFIIILLIILIIICFKKRNNNTHQGPAAMHPEPPIVAPNDQRGRLSIPVYAVADNDAEGAAGRDRIIHNEPPSYDSVRGDRQSVNENCEINHVYVSLIPDAEPEYVSMRSNVISCFHSSPHEVPTQHK